MKHEEDTKSVYKDFFWKPEAKNHMQILEVGLQAER
jgi:hypothetical protein